MKSYCREEGCTFSSGAQYGEKARSLPTSGNVVLGCLAWEFGITGTNPYIPVKCIICQIRHYLETLMTQVETNTLIIIMLSALHILFESSRYEYTFVFLYMSAWQHLAKTFLLREQIKATSKQACYCSTAWVPASKKQIDDYLAVAVKENCKFSEKFFLFFFFFLVVSALI